jgi:Flp pilus assembly protein CpaB
MPYLSRDRQTAQLAGKKNKSPLSIVLLLAIVALIGTGVFRLVNKPASPDMVQVVGVAQDMPPGCRLGFRSLHYVQIPRLYHRKDMFESYDQVVGKVTRTFIAQGEPLMQSSLFHSSAGLARQVMLPERALTLKLTSDALLDHNLYPGDRVDVIATTSGKQGKKYTRTIGQNIRVLMCVPKEALLSSKLRSEEQEKVTLAFLPADAEKVTEAIECGKVRLALRNPGNQAIARLPGSDERDLLPYQSLMEFAKPVTLPPAPLFAGLPPLAPPPAPGTTTAPANPVQWFVDVFTGSKKETQAFDVK